MITLVQDWLMLLVLDRTYKGDYDSEQLSLKVSAGAPNEVSDGTFVTPFAGVTASIVKLMLTLRHLQQLVTFLD